MAEPLQGLHIAVTRPRAQALPLAQRIAQLGGTPLFYPLLEITPVDAPGPVQALARNLATYDLLIFISPNAVQYGMALLGTLPQSARVAAVGQSSARALRDLGIAHVIAPHERFDSEALLAMAELQRVAGWRIAILRGNGGRELLGDTLKARGATVEYITCYQRSKGEFDAQALLAAPLDALTVTSSEALDHLWQMFAPQDRERLLALPLFVPHERIAGLARQLGWRQVVVTAAGDDGLLAALVAWGKTSS